MRWSTRSTAATPADALLLPPDPAILLQMVKMVREPNNPYDRQAVRVDNVVGEKVGHLSRQVAAVVRLPTPHRSLSPKRT